MTITLTGTPHALNVGQQRHSAFPGVAQLADGTVHLVWREGSDHVSARDGAVVGATSLDGGRSYGNVRALRYGRGDDHRDPSLSVIDGALHLTFFIADRTAPAKGAFAQREWGPAAYRVDNGLGHAAITAPLVLLPNGQLGGAFYGRQAGEGIDTAFMAWSSDGATWTTNRIVNMLGGNTAANEPYLVVDGELVHFFFRWGNTEAIGVRTLADSGRTAQGPPRRILNNATGRPTVLRTAAGTLVMVYRQLSSRSAWIAYSTDRAATWVDGGLLLPSVGGIGMTYATMFEPEPGRIRGVVGLEGPTGTTSTLYTFDLIES